MSNLGDERSRVKCVQRANERACVVHTSITTETTRARISTNLRRTLDGRQHNMRAYMTKRMDG